MLVSISDVMSLRHGQCVLIFFFFFQAEDGIRDLIVTGVQTCALPISREVRAREAGPAEQIEPRIGTRVDLELDAVAHRAGRVRDEELRRHERIRHVQDRKSTRLNSSHDQISYAVFCLKKKKNTKVKSN